MKKALLKIFLSGIVLMNTGLHSQQNNLGDNASSVSEASYEEELKFAEALDLFQEKKYSYAVVIFNEFLQLYPETSRRNEVYDFLTQIYMRQQQFQRCSEILLAKIHFNMNSEAGLKARLELGELYVKTAKVKEAKMIFQEILSLSPDSSYAESAMTQLRLLGILPEKNQETEKK